MDKKLKVLRAYVELPDYDKHTLRTQVSHSMLENVSPEEEQMIGNLTDRINETLPPTAKLSYLEVVALLIEVSFWLLKQGA
jgi:hypothetical protein